MVNMGVFVPGSVLFPEGDHGFPSFRSLLQPLSRTDVLFWCARINHVLAGTAGLDHEQRQAFGLRQFCTTAQLRRLDEFCKQQDRTTSDVTIFFRGQLLELLRWAALYCDDQPNDGTTFEDPATREAFLQACLRASEYWSLRVYGNAFDLTDGLDVARQRSLGPIRAGIEGSATTGEWAHHLGRGYQLFCDYLPRIDPGFALAFQRVTGMTTEEYLMCWSVVITTYAKRTTELTIFNAHTAADPTASADLFRQFICIEAQTPTDLRASLWPGIDRDDPRLSPIFPYNVKALRERPILRAADGRSLIVDPVFALDKCSIGPLFHALRCANANALFAAFGKAFEQYVTDLLRRVFPHVPGMASPLACNITGRSCTGEEYEIDAALNYVTELVLVEIKAVWARDTDLSPEHAPTFLEHLRQQFGVTEESVKGTGQLARVVNALASDTWTGPEHAFADVRTIYPVLVVHDRRSAAPGFGTFIVDEFRRALLPHDVPRLGELRIGALRVIAPVVLTADDIELLEVSLEHRGFRDVVNDFHRWSPDRMAPFGSFLAEQSRSGRVYANRTLAGSAVALMRKAINRFFPQPS